MPTDTDSPLMEILRNAPVREREDWLVIHDLLGIRKFWTGSDWSANREHAAHFANMEGGLGVVRLLESFMWTGNLYTRPVKEG